MCLPRRHQRGSALLVAIIVIAVLGIVAAGLVRRSTNEIESAGAKRRYDTAVSCADGARQMLLSTFRATGMNVAELTLNQTVGSTQYGTGHYNTFALATVKPTTAAKSFAEAKRNIANSIVQSALGGQVYSATVVCRNSADTRRQAEVEFLVRFGL